MTVIEGEVIEVGDPIIPSIRLEDLKGLDYQTEMGRKQTVFDKVTSRLQVNNEGGVVVNEPDGINSNNSQLREAGVNEGWLEPDEAAYSLKSVLQLKVQTQNASKIVELSGRSPAVQRKNEAIEIVKKRSAKLSEVLVHGLLFDEPPNSKENSSLVKSCQQEASEIRKLAEQKRVRLGHRKKSRLFTKR